jgi:hypothetical protein
MTSSALAERDMRIALDYDDTFTMDETLWRGFVDAALTRGHSVAIVTSRKRDGDNRDLLADATMLGVPVVFCDFRPKADCHTADVWIDDTPLTIPSVEAMRFASMGPNAK